MTTYDATESNSTGTQYELLETGIYRMKIVKSTIEENRLDEPRPDGTYSLQHVVTWEVSGLIGDQDDESIIGTQVWQRINFWYGDTKNGPPSKLKAWVDKIRAQGLVEEFNPSAYDPELFIGVEQRVNVQQYIKTMGKNAGQPGNKVIDVLPLKPVKKAPQAAATPPAGVQRKRPATTDESEDLF